MPQIMPMNWTILIMMSNWMLLMWMIMMYFIFLNKNNNYKKIYQIKNKFKIKW